MKTVFTSAELPHIWAHQKAPHGRSPGAMSFDGGSYYSYAACIAHIFPEQNAVLISSHRWSNTTTNHQSAVRRAIPGTMREFYGDTKELSNPRAFCEAMLKVAQSESESALKTKRDHPKRKAVIATHESRCLAALKTAQECSKHFKLKIKCSMAGIKAMAKREAQARLERIAASEAREKQREADAQEKLMLWLKGEPVTTSGLPSGQTHLRLFRGKVETSQGITVELSEFRRALDFVCNYHLRITPANIHYTVAGYRIDSIADTGVVAGCHRFSWQEIKRFKAYLDALPGDLTQTA